MQFTRSPALTSAGLGRRSYASRIDIPFAPPPVPTIERCPTPTCPCRESPSGLDIEREQGINGSMPAYAEQVLISTGKDDWSSRIEDEEDGVLVRQLKGFLGRNGKYSDVSQCSPRGRQPLTDTLCSHITMSCSLTPPSHPHPPSLIRPSAQARRQQAPPSQPAPQAKTPASQRKTRLAVRPPQPSSSLASNTYQTSPPSRQQ